MNKESLYTTGKKLTGKYGTIVYIMSVFDLEPSGIIVQGYNQMDSKEHILPISEKELSAAGISRSQNDLAWLINTIDLVPQGDTFVLESSIECISKQKKLPKGDEITALIQEPMGDGIESVHQVLVKGLVELCKVKPVGPEAVKFLGEWLLVNNPNKPSVNEPIDDEKYKFLFEILQ